MATQIVTTLITVFTSYVTPLATAIANMFSNLFWVAATVGENPVAAHLTVLGEGLITCVGIGIVGAIFRVVYRIFASKLSKRVS